MGSLRPPGQAEVAEIDAVLRAGGDVPVPVVGSPVQESGVRRLLLPERPAVSPVAGIGRDPGRGGDPDEKAKDDPGDKKADRYPYSMW